MNARFTSIVRHRAVKLALVSTAVFVVGIFADFSFFVNLSMFSTNHPAFVFMFYGVLIGLPYFLVCRLMWWLGTRRRKSWTEN